MSATVHTEVACRLYIGAAAHEDAFRRVIDDAAGRGLPVRIMADPEGVPTFQVMIAVTVLAAGMGHTVRWALVLPGPRAIDMFLIAPESSPARSPGPDSGTVGAPAPVTPSGAGTIDLNERFTS